MFGLVAYSVNLVTDSYSLQPNDFKPIHSCKGHIDFLMMKIIKKFTEIIAI